MPGERQMSARSEIIERQRGAVGQGGGNVVEKTDLCTKCMIKKSCYHCTIIMHVYLDLTSSILENGT